MCETLNPVNHILSMGPASSICSLYLQGFALITSREKHRVEVGKGQTLANGPDGGFPGCARRADRRACVRACVRPWATRAILPASHCSQGETYLWLQRSLLTKWHHFANVNTWAVHTRSHMVECKAIFCWWPWGGEVCSYTVGTSSWVELLLLQKVLTVKGL